MAKRQFTLTEKEANKIRQTEMQSQDKREHQRLQALRLYGTGMSTKDVIDVTNSSQRSIQRWVKDYQAQGIAGLTPKWNNQNAAKLTRDQRAEIKERLHQHTPQQILPPDSHIHSGQFWTVSSLRVVVQMWYEVVYKSDDSYRNLLHECGFSYQKTERVYRSRPDEIVVADFEAQLEKK